VLDRQRALRRRRVDTARALGFAAAASTGAGEPRARGARPPGCPRARGAAAGSPDWQRHRAQCDARRSALIALGAGAARATGQRATQECVRSIPPATGRNSMSTTGNSEYRVQNAERTLACLIVSLALLGA